MQFLQSLSTEIEERSPFTGQGMQKVTAASQNLSACFNLKNINNEVGI